ncbi:dipeptidyl-peptidase 5 precursor [Lineolata rhizophorae]|uniref:Dipeptidyl-peptidase V n=1 Tax=Lineolata rhizophorae TaxID=578093 RepID=A0A6A6P728_9PEZI|nr:dipeptidyl-peptidase 5 precursor [Lineolata rhizophorae]
MTIRATKFTPKVLLSAPRRSAGVPNSDASRVLYTVSAYSFETHEHAPQELRVLGARSGESLAVAKDVSEPHWLDDETVAVLKGAEEGKTAMLVGKVDNWDESHYAAALIDGSVSAMKIADLQDGTYAVAFMGRARPDGSLLNSTKEPKKHTSGRLYSSLFVRHWDTYVNENRNAIFYGLLRKSESSSDSSYELSRLHNALKGTRLESPIPPFGGSDCFDISCSGVIFVAKDPEFNPATNTKCNVYVTPLSSFVGAPPQPSRVDLDDLEGACTSPVFSPDGRMAAVLAMRKNGYESDKNHIVLIPDVSRPSSTDLQLKACKNAADWDRSPSSLAFSSDTMNLFLTAEEHGRQCLFSLPVDLFGATVPAKVLMASGTVTDFRPLDNGDIFISGNNFVDNSQFYLLPRGSHSNPLLLSSNSRNGYAFGLSPKQVDEIWFQGANTNVHAWVLKPSNFIATEKYPLAYVIHGGPQGAWTDAWSTRWNPAVFAEQGYVVVMPNPTGSTGYGQKFVDAIRTQWGGYPYIDLVKGFEFIEEHMPFVDMTRAVALGASYGGFMINWIQGQPLGRKFRALVTHDGVFSMTGQTASEELYFPEHDLGGKFWANRDEWHRWDPSQHTHNWATPHLIIHSELDYRLTIAEGLAAFNMLQDRGVESQFLTFPDENHWVLKPENSLLWHTVVIDWINKHVGLPLFSESGEGKEVLEEARMDR